MNRPTGREMQDFAFWGMTLTAIALLILWAHAANSDHRSSVFRVPASCTTQAKTAEEVIRDNSRFGGLIDAIEAAPVRGADKPAVAVDGSLGPFDHRVPSLTACIGGR